jgi:hypothetical protein
MSNRSRRARPVLQAPAGLPMTPSEPGPVSESLRLIAARRRLSLCGAD